MPQTQAAIFPTANPEHPVQPTRHHHKYICLKLQAHPAEAAGAFKLQVHFSGRTCHHTWVA